MHSYNYKGGTITVRSDGTVSAWRHGSQLYEGRSESHAKAALTRYFRAWRAERDAEHYASIQAIWGR